MVTSAKYHTYGWYLSRTRISRISRIYFSLQATVLTMPQWKNSEGVKNPWDPWDPCGKNSTLNIIIKSMDLRSYTKQELALLYFPDSDPDVARSHLMRWIVRCTQLYEQLLKSGYTKNSKEFNPLQVSYIFFHLGEPWYLSVIIVEYRGATLSIGELGMRNVVSLHCDSERDVAHGSHRSHGSSSLQATGILIWPLNGKTPKE